MSRSVLLSVLVFAVPAVAQQSAALFDAAVAQLADDSPPFQRLFDYDGDGDMDAVGARVRSDGLNYEVRVWRNDQGRYVQAFNDLQNAIGGTGAFPPLAIGDFDHDGDQDFVVGTGLAHYRYSNTNSQWSRTTTTTSAKVGGLAAGDFDGDGLVDLAVFTRDPTIQTAPGQLRLHLGAGPQVTVAVPASLQLYSHLEVLDLDGDPAQELGISYVTQNQFHRYDLVGGALVALPLLTAPVTAPDRFSYWSSGDVDGDGDVDVVAFELPTQTAPGRVHCFRRNGPTTFVTEAAYLGGPAEFLADADGDGDLDGVCCGGGGSGPPTWPGVGFGSVFEIALNDGQGVFAPAFQMAGRGSSRLAGVADVDLDGDPDLVAGSAVYYGRGTLRPATSPLAGRLDPGLVFWIQGTGDQLGDFDRDGDPDFLSTLPRQGVNDGHGFFQLVPNDLSAMIPPGYVDGLPRFRGDFDGDGAPDYVIPLFQAGSQFSHMAFVRNNGSGKLAYAGAAAAFGVRIGWQFPTWATTATSALSADLDGDGDIDLVANADANYEIPYRSELWWNQGNATFVAGPAYPTERTELAVDVDADGRVDLSTRTAVGALAIRLGTGVAATPFGPALPVLPAGGYDTTPGAFVVVDANDDGRPDILARGYQAGGIATFQLSCNMTTTVGTPVFQTATGLIANGNWTLGSVSVFDVDGDGRSDLVQTSPAGFTFAVRIRRRIGGDQQVLQPQHYAPAVEQVIWDGFPTDIDADGDLDLVGGMVARNVRFHGPTAGIRQQFGTGTAGEAGVAPLLGAAGTVRAGGIVELRLSGVTGPTVAVLAITLARANLANVPLPGVTCLVDPATAITGVWTLPAPGGGQARGAAALPIWLPPGLQGFEFFDQVFVLDPAAPSGLAASNGLFTRIGS